MSGVRLRRPRQRDVADVTALLHRAHAALAPGWGPAALSEAMVEQRLMVDEVRLARDAKGWAVGCVAVTGPSAAVGRIEWLAVDPAARGRGIARQLLAVGEKLAARRGHRAVEILLAPQASSLVTVLVRSGYVLDGEAGLRLTRATDPGQWRAPRRRVRIAVGSTNPTKVTAVARAAFRVGLWNVVEGVDVQSGVRAMPIGQAELRAGAANRAQAALRLLPKARFGVGIEGGVVWGPAGEAWLTNAVVVRERDGTEMEGTGGRLKLPARVAQGIAQGAELGPLMDELTGVANMKQREGAVGHLTRGRIDRTEAETLSVLMALPALLSRALYRSQDPAG